MGKKWTITAAIFLVASAPAAAIAELGAFKIECVADNYAGEPRKVVFQRSMKYDDKYFEMGIGPRADSPVAYELIEARLSNEIFGVAMKEPFLTVHFGSIDRDFEFETDPHKQRLFYTLSFWKNGNIRLIHAGLNHDKTRLISVNSSDKDGSNYRDCISVGIF